MKNPEIIRTVRIVALNYDNQVYGFIRPLNSKQRAGDVDFAGGKVNVGEELEVAARREFEQETGVAIDCQLAYHYGVSERDGDTLYMREYFILQQRIAANEIKQLTEHIGMVCASKLAIIELIDFIPHQEVLKCFDIPAVA